MFHKDLYKGNYQCDPDFNHDHFCFIEANPEVEVNFDSSFFSNVIKEYELPTYNPRLQKATYMAPSIIYHVYKNKLHTDVNYVGFLEYDIPLKVENGPESVTRRITEIIEGHDRVIIPYRYKHKLQTYHNQEDITLNGKNAIEQIFIDYNNYWGTNYDYRNYLQCQVVGQQSFLADTATFDNLMEFIEYVIEKRLAERPGSFRRPSTLLDRYIAVAILLDEKAEKIPIPLNHQNKSQWEDNLSLVGRFANRLKFW